jgi:hypothetical protein
MGVGLRRPDFGECKDYLMSDESAVNVCIGGYVVKVATGPLAVFRRDPDRPRTVDHFPETDGDHAGYLSVAVDDGQENWPLLVTQTYSPTGPGFEPGVLLAPETGMVFIGAGTRLLGYRSTASEWHQIFVDEVEVGFWNWRRHDDIVLMSAELELAAWSLEGTKLWSRFVEPPWGYTVTGDQIHLDVMGAHSQFSTRTGNSGQTDR